jgi:hypothetical protein
MARLHLPILIGFVLPLALVVVNLALGYGGLLAFIFLVIWLGLAVFLVTPEDHGTT